MKYTVLSLLSVWVFLLAEPSYGQITGYKGDESALYAATKQINQFFRRFNNEEDLSGKRLYPTDKGYRGPSQREKYLNILFDQQNTAITRSMKDRFIRDVNSAAKPQFLDFKAGNWFAEVRVTFTYKGRQENGILFFELEQENLGHKWVMSSAYFQPFARLFAKPDGRERSFLHPMSHELAFMNLNKVFEAPETVEDYTDKNYSPDHLTLLFYELKSKNLVFQSVQGVKFHFFQLQNWYFEVAEFNRSGNNTGWLISGLTELNSPQERDALRNFILRKS